MSFLMKNEYNHMYETEHEAFQKKVRCDEAALRKQFKKMGLVYEGNRSLPEATVHHEAVTFTTLVF